MEVFHLLGEAESKAHGIPVDQVHFHEVGADDTILDITAATWLLSVMDIGEIYASPLPLGTRSHGRMPWYHAPSCSGFK